MWYVVYSTNMLEPIYVAYLSELESHDENTESDAMLKELSKPSGIAVKVAINKWQIHLDNETGRLVQLVGTVPVWMVLGADSPMESTSYGWYCRFNSYEVGLLLVP